MSTSFSDFFRNALSLEMLQSIQNDLLQTMGKRAQVVIISANGPVFSSGHDLKELVSSNQCWGQGPCNKSWRSSYWCDWSWSLVCRHMIKEVLGDPPLGVAFCKPWRIYSVGFTQNAPGPAVLRKIFPNIVFSILL